MMKVTAIFDIGKTNKKFFLFDENYQEVFKTYSHFEEIEDEDGFPADDLAAIQDWIKTIFHQILQNKAYQVEAVNFSTYGASFVHIDQKGQPVAPLYNYTKPYSDDILQSFYDKYGSALKIAKETASPPLQMLNAGLQLYWLKYAKPQIFNKIRWSLHLPQYISFLFTGIPVSDYTSIGCHTMLWDFEKKDYHDWVYAEEIDKILPPIISANTSINKNYDGQIIKMGIGIHDSSAALLPYLQADKKPFLLISTGTWSISLNPYKEEILTEEDLLLDCLNYMRIDGKPVKAARLFLGNEYRIQVEKLCTHFGKAYGYHRKIKFDKALYHRLKLNELPHFHFESINLPRTQPEMTRLDVFENFKTAFHQLMIELVELQVQSVERAIGDTPIQKIYIDGGFADNDIYLQLLKRHFTNYTLYTAKSPLGSALGAAMMLSDRVINKEFLKNNYALKKLTLAKLIAKNG
ncbi:MAG: FGGY family carbohydrate kinase [Saprospiraceae bacterium]|nr:FGGY family carbohydrate kinase [Saprospiraceae bacterium]